MPGLTLNTDIDKARTSVIVPPPPPPQLDTQPPGVQEGTRPPADSGDIPSNRIDHAAAQTPQEVASLQDVRPGSPPPQDGSGSPQAPPYSPITPPLRASELPARPEYTHLDQLPQTASDPPPPESIDFASNPDVLGLQSAIAILQMQKRKAAADMVALSKAKAAALADPAAFLADLGSGRVGQEGDNLFLGGDGDDDSSTDSDSELDEHAEGPSSATKLVDGASTRPPPRQKSKKDRKSKSSTQTSTTTSQPPQPWQKLPKPQNVVRMPAINWSQYAIVGESLDKLHQEQVSAPTQGTPAIVQADGTYDFTFGSGPSGIFNKQEKLVGIAAPYNPGKDKLQSPRRTSGMAAQSNLQQQQQQVQQSQPEPPGPAETQSSAAASLTAKQ